MILRIHSLSGVDFDDEDFGVKEEAKSKIKVGAHLTLLETRYDSDPSLV